MGKRSQEARMQKERPWRRAGLGLAIALMVCSLAKMTAVVFFDLGAISNITGEINSDIAVASGMGKVCLIGALLMFVAAVYGLRLYSGDRDIARSAAYCGCMAIACGIITAAVAITGGHNPSDIATSCIGTIIAVGMTACALRLTRR